MKSYNDTLRKTAKPKEYEKYKISAIILCAGKGERMGLPYNKMFYHIGEQTILEITVENFATSGLFDQIICACSPEEIEDAREFVLPYGAEVCVGGLTRTESVRRALAKVSPDTDILLVHDGARPWAVVDHMRDVIDSAIAFGSGIPAIPVVDAIKVARDGIIVNSPDRNELVAVQTPQAFRYAEIADAYARVIGNYADDSEVYGQAGYAPRLVRGSLSNRKITNLADVYNTNRGQKIGFGYDAHELVDGRDLILGGVYIPYEKGLLGHSDADVLAHAVMDAMLSAGGLPDIGVLFPDNDPAYEGISSTYLLGKVAEMLRERKITVQSVSAVVMAEKPKLAGYISHMRECIARTIGIPSALVNISATTTEKLGVVGDGKGIASSAVVLVGI